MTFEGALNFHAVLLFTFMSLHFADAFIQSNLLLFEVILTVSVCCLGTKPMTLAVIISLKFDLKLDLYFFVRFTPIKQKSCVFLPVSLCCHALPADPVYPSDPLRQRESDIE